jgi:hypothetical protein
VSKSVLAPFEILLLHSYEDYYGNRESGRTDLPEIRSVTPGMLAWVAVCDVIVATAQTPVHMYQKTRFHTPEDAFGVTNVST